MGMPKLRFKEFDGDWLHSKIGEVASVTSGGTPSRANPEYWDGDIPWVTTSLVDFNVIHSAEEFITKQGVNNSSAKLFPKDTILMAMYGQGITRGKVAILGIEATTNQACCAIKLKDNFDKQFIFQNLMNRYDEIRDLSNDGGQKNLSAGIIKDISISIPSKEEQTKIAVFLSTVDEKISQLNQKHELLSQYKQGMMQKLFSQQIRFKEDDGSEFGEWEETTLGQTGKFVGGGTPSKENTEFWQGSIPWISSSDLVEESIFKINISRLISENALSQSATKLVPANSILIVSRVGVGKVAITQHDICTSQDFTSLILNNGNSIFFAYLIKSLTPYLLEMNQGTSIKGFVKEDLSNLEIQVPSLEEQAKIANFLFIIDKKIEVVVQQIKQAKQWKKGLLQQMFV